jgi:transcriptional regulator with XRE-family HTH domain
MKREELLKSKEYWITKIQLDLFEVIEDYLKANKLTKKQLADKLGVSKSYISQILNGNFDHKISKLVELSLAFDKVPLLKYENINSYVIDDTFGIETKVNKKVVIDIFYSANQQIKEELLDSFTNINKSLKISLSPFESMNSNSIILNKC